MLLVFFNFKILMLVRRTHLLSQLKNVSIGIVSAGLSIFSIWIAAREVNYIYLLSISGRALAYTELTIYLFIILAILILVIFIKRNLPTGIIVKWKPKLTLAIACLIPYLIFFGAQFCFVNAISVTKDQMILVEHGQSFKPEMLELPISWFLFAFLLVSFVLLTLNFTLKTSYLKKRFLRRIYIYPLLFLSISYILFFANSFVMLPSQITDIAAIILSTVLCFHFTRYKNSTLLKELKIVGHKYTATLLLFIFLSPIVIQFFTVPFPLTIDFGNGTYSYIIQCSGTISNPTLTRSGAPFEIGNSTLLTYSFANTSYYHSVIKNIADCSNQEFARISFHDKGEVYTRYSIIPCILGDATKINDLKIKILVDSPTSIIPDNRAIFLFSNNKWEWNDYNREIFLYKDETMRFLVSFSINSQTLELTLNYDQSNFQELSLKIQVS
jgi:hypothetical protein